MVTRGSIWLTLPPGFNRHLRPFIGLLLGLLTSACQDTQPHTIVFAVATAPSVLDPRLASDASSERTNALLYDRLVTLDEKGSPQPAMASWQALSPRHYLITLNPQRATFWNGEKPTAIDVAETYRSLLDPAAGSPHTGALSHIERIEVVSRDRLAFRLSRGDPQFISRLTLGIAPAQAIRKGGLARRPMGSGAFEFMRWRDDGGALLLRRSDGQRIALTPVSDPTMRTLKLLRGEAHLLQNDLPAELFVYLDRQQDLQLQERPGTTFAYIGFNLADPVLSDRNVRAAIAHAIDRDAIIAHLFGARAQKAESVLRPEHWAGVTGLQGYDYDPARARALLERAGYGPERPLDLGYKTSTDPFRVRIAHVFQSQLAEVGIRLKLASYDWGTFFGDIRAGRFQLYSLAWVGVNTPDIFRYAFHSISRPPGGANRGGYASASVDRLIDAAESADPDRAAALYAEVQRQVHKDLVYVPLWYESNLVASRGVRGYLPGHDGAYLSLSQVRMVDDGRQ